MTTQVPQPKRMRQQPARQATRAATTPAPTTRKTAAVRATAEPAGIESSLKAPATRLGRIELAGLAGQLVKGWRQDIEAIAKARRRSYAGLQAVVMRQSAQVKEAIAEWQTVGRLAVTIGPRRSVSHADKLAIAAFQLALADIRELATLAANSQRDAFDILQQRIDKNVDDVQRLLQP